MKHSITLNIGLVTNDGQPINPDQVRARLVQLGFSCVSNDVQQSETEPTLVWRGAYYSGFSGFRAALDILCDEFSQDCIAYRIQQTDLVSSGLIGPQSIKRAPFNPDHFLP